VGELVEERRPHLQDRDGVVDELDRFVCAAAQLEVPADDLGVQQSIAAFR